MVNLFGEEKTVPGRIWRIDLLAHRIIIHPSGGMKTWQSPVLGLTTRPHLFY